MATSVKGDKKRKKEGKPQHQEEDDVPRLKGDIKRRNKKRKLHQSTPVAAAEREEDDRVRAKHDKLKREKNKDEKKKKKQRGRKYGGDDPQREGEGEEEEVERKTIGLITDKRFASVHSDPRFQRVPRHELKVPIDSRFARMFSDKSFASSSAPVDKRGKPRKGRPVNPLLHYYLHQDDKGEEDEEPAGPEDGDSKSPADESKSPAEESKSGSEGDVLDEEELFSRQSDADASSTDDEDEDEDDDYSVDSDIARYLMANHEDTPMTEHETHRLAVVNMDWEHVKAVDLYVVMSSCLPKGGQILLVTIYPSELGLKCMEVESVHGPSALFDDNEEHSEDDSEIENAKLRTYELNKLRYYYAVVVCDSSATANHIYKTLDGTELLKTSNVFDLRFIPDSMEFKHPAHDITTEAPTSYKEPDFHTRALQQSRVKLTWEENEPHRTKILRRKFNPNQLDELKEYLASSGGSDNDDENCRESDGDESDDTAALLNGEGKKHMDREKLLSLLQSEDDSDADHTDDKDMEITFNTGLEDLSKRILEKKDKKSETVWEAVLRKRSEKKKARKKRSKYSSEDDSSDFDVQEAPDQPDDFFVEESFGTDAKARSINSKDKSKIRGKSSRKGREQFLEIDKEQEASRAELELLFVDDQGADHGPKGYNLKPKIAKKGKEMPAEEKLPNVDYKDDPRFSALLNSHLFALDPTDPQFKRSAAYARQRSRKLGTGAREEATEEEATNPSEHVQLQSDDMAPSRDENLHPVRVSSSEKERHDFSSTVRSLKRNLVTLKKEPKGR